MTHKQLPQQHFLALFITVLVIFFYIKIVFDITPPPTAYVLIALPFLGFAIYYFWDFVTQYRVYVAIGLITLIGYNIFSTEDSNKKKENCLGDEKCKSAVQQRLSSTGKMDLGMRHSGDGTFTGYAQDLQKQATFQYTISTDCNCKITDVQIIGTER